MEQEREYGSIIVSKKDQVATISFLTRSKIGAGKPIPWEISSALNDLREDIETRVIVFTGAEGHFKIPRQKEVYHREVNNPADILTKDWYGGMGLMRCLMTMADIEKPIVAKVNGDAIGFGQSLAFGSDFIIAREDATFLDHHMGGTFMADYDGEVKEGGHDFSIVPGDGGAALVPLHMSPCKAKEYLMLAEPITAAELARLGIINYAVPAAELDAKVDAFVNRLLSKGAYALAWTKRVVNKRLMQHLILTMDAGIAYERVNFLHLEKLGGVEKKTFA